MNQKMAKSCGICILNKFQKKVLIKKKICDIMCEEIKLNITYHFYKGKIGGKYYE